MAIQLQQVEKAYGSQPNVVSVLRGVDLSLEEGGSVAVLGPSGSGKSTLLHVLGGLDAPTAGSVSVGGQDPYALSEPELARFRNRTVGFVFQEHHLLPQFSVLENVLLPTQAFPPPPAGTEEYAVELLERVGLAHRLAHRPAELSGGERQRAAVARALLLSPALILGDEPTGNLDRKNAEAIVDLLLSLHRDQNNVLVVVTHSEDLAQRFDRRIQLRDGQCFDL